MFGKICACRAILGSIGRKKSPSMVYLIICSLEDFALMVFVVGQNVFLWVDTAMKLTVHPE